MHEETCAVCQGFDVEEVFWDGMMDHGSSDKETRVSSRSPFLPSHLLYSRASKYSGEFHECLCCEEPCEIG